MNAFGACDNLAWIWIAERDVRQANGNPLQPRMVGLGESYLRVRGSLTQPLLDVLDDRQTWFDHLKDFRDSLAHCMPLYIPPYMIDPANDAQYAALSEAAHQALVAGDFAAHQQRLAERDALRHFTPLMTHALAQGAALIYFHPQLQADLRTVGEIATAFLDEL